MKKRGTLSLLFLSFVLVQTALSQTQHLEVKVSSFTDTLAGGVGEIDRDIMGNLFVSDFGEKVWKISPRGEVEVWTDRMYGASGNTLDAQGNLYQANYYGNTIVKLNRYTRKVSEVAHDGLFGPVGMAFLNSELYVCNCNNNTISKIDEEGKVTKIAGGSMFNCPNGITPGRDGNLYVVNYRNPDVVRIDTEGNAMVFATLPASSGGHIIEHKGNFYVTSFFSHKIFKVSSKGGVTHFAGTGVPGIKNGTGFEAQFINPNGIVAGNGSLFVNDKIPATSGKGLSTVVRRITFPDFSRVMTRAMNAGGLDGARKAYEAYKANPLFEKDITEAELNILAYNQLGQSNHELAIGLFQLNADSYPESFNVWDSLAEGYLVKGDKKKAKKFYQKSLELNPQNNNAKTKLKEL